ncbi:helix-turn-helix domain-containing protein [Planosporangium sp. 12N6]|uniref:helix-turn-helix domain-containing protein n=1 Tax=Planosporangium spinosum TaxID=3402278 RepID=UPI003CEBCF09
MTTDHGSTVPRRQLGRYLRQLREDAQITVRAAAEALEWSTPRLWRIEKGAVPMRALDVKNMCQVYGVAPDITEALMGLAKETRARGWWHSYGDAVPAWFELYVGLESAASRLRKYESELIPGLLQTKAYATETFQVARPETTPEELDRSVAVRLERQGLLTRRVPAAPRLDVVLNEAALRRPIRDRDAMAAQLEHLVDMAQRPNVSVRVLPLSAGLHRASSCGAFTILEFPESAGGRDGEPATVYSDNLTGALYLDKPAEVAAYAEVWRSVVDACLDEPRSHGLIAAIAREYTT